MFEKIKNYHRNSLHLVRKAKPFLKCAMEQFLYGGVPVRYVDTQNRFTVPSEKVEAEV